MGFFEDLQQILSDFETSILEDVQKEVQAELSIIAEKPVEDYVVPYMNVQNINGSLFDMNGYPLTKIPDDSRNPASLDNGTLRFHEGKLQNVIDGEWKNVSENLCDYTYCENTIEGGQWLGVFTLNTSDGNLKAFGNSFYKTSDTIQPSNGWMDFLKVTCKSPIFNHAPFKEIMIATSNENGEIVSYGIYDLLPEFVGKSWYELLNLPNTSKGTKITGKRKAQWGNTGWVYNNDRDGNNSWKCEFTDPGTNEELRINWYADGGAAKYSKENDTLNYVHITTGLGDNDTTGHGGYEHCFSGIGGHHERPAGSWNTSFDYAGYSEYCDLKSRFGTNAISPDDGNGYAVYKDNCFNGSVITRNVSIFVR